MFAVSAATEDSPLMPNDQLDEWLVRRRQAYAFEVTRIPFAELSSWSFAPETGNLGHDSGRFFTIQGLHVRTDTQVWSQPIINQPEIGILGIAVKEFDGVLHFLMQAKMEPGCVNAVQLAPTVQATRSNYTQVHGGRRPHFLDWFTEPSGVLVDTLQSEHGSWFLRKRNRNMIAFARGDAEGYDDFRWLTLGQIMRLLNQDDIVNMDARTVLACIPFRRTTVNENPAWTVAPGDPCSPSRWISHWLTDVRSRRELVQQTVPCHALTRWRRTYDEIFHVRRRHFTVIAVRVDAASREVGSWTQPLVKPVGVGVAAMVVKELGGETKLLMQARVEAGLIDIAELAPTVQCLPVDYGHRPPPFLDYVLTAEEGRIRYDAVQSEEGGRFYHARTRYMVVEAEPAFEPTPHDGYVWVSLADATALIARGYQVNVQARTLIAALHGSVHTRRDANGFLTMTAP
ncbi:NDP-hexose 2,3-dehydratase family protein [Haloechinothrix salitolerans]